MRYENQIAIKTNNHVILFNLYITLIKNSTGII